MPRTNRCAMTTTTGNARVKVSPTRQSSSHSATNATDELSSEAPTPSRAYGRLAVAAPCATRAVASPGANDDRSPNRSRWRTMWVCNQTVTPELIEDGDQAHDELRGPEEQHHQCQ